MVFMLAITNAIIYDGKGNRFEDQNLIIENGKFAKLVPASKIPDFYHVIDAQRKVVTPGLIDVHTHLGISEEGVGLEGADYNETSSSVTPSLRAIDGINPMEIGFEDARKSGVTTAQIMPGSANVIGEKW